MASSVRSTAIKRIQGDVREMMKDPSDQYYAAPLEDNMFDWHFTLRGPRDTEFEGGIYHGRILLPSDYPFKPPNIMLLTPNGRFEVRKKICLSISAYHPEEWQPAWGIRLILEALISFMPTKGEGAIGALDYPPQERRRLAKLSCDYTCEICGRVADLLPELKSEEEKEKKPSKYADQIAQLHIHSMEPATGSNDAPTKEEAATETGTAKEDSKVSVVATSQATTRPDADTVEASQEEMADQTPPGPSESDQGPHQPPQQTEPAPPAAAVQAAPAPRPVPPRAAAPPPQQTQIREPDFFDSVLHYVTVALAVALFALVYRKFLQWQGVLQ